MLRPMRRALLAILIGSGLCLGCEPSIPEGVFACASDDDCPPGWVCRESNDRCYTTADPPPDAG